VNVNSNYSNLYCQSNYNPNFQGKVIIKVDKIAELGEQAVNAVIQAKPELDKLVKGKNLELTVTMDNRVIDFESGWFLQPIIFNKVKDIKCIVTRDGFFESIYDKLKSFDGFDWTKNDYSRDGVVKSAESAIESLLRKLDKPNRIKSEQAEKIRLAMRMNEELKNK